MTQKTTIYDIAKRLGITAATVSRALNGNPRISASTKQLVLETAKQMNYEPNRLALALKKGKSKTIGVVVPHINRNFFSGVIRGIEDELHPKGYHVIIAQTHEDGKREAQTVKNLLNAQVEGILISLAAGTHEGDYFKQVLQKGIPLVFFDRKKELEGISSVVIDDYQGAYNATKHLIEQGCKRIAHFSVHRSLNIYEQRYEGYKTALEDHQMQPDPDLIIEIKSDIEEGKKAAEKLMALDSPPDAIFSSTDYGALGAVKWLTKNGYEIPGDVSIVGFSNEPFTQFMELSISSVDQAPVEMGRMAAKVFLEKVKDSANVKIQKQVVLSPKLHIRQSSNKIEASQN